ncbi:MAG: hypothetical protein JNJ83_15080 [Verrucomicrobiaceae bacterium]|nr:hypothetical protein [Verrucomicrobiaceae bacterium]
MNRLFAFFAIIYLAGASTSHALSGGPFDNGFGSAGLEDGAVYQAVLSYRNGNGFCYFHPEANIVGENLASPLAFNARGSLQNRSVLYYKGITYVGSAIGMTDPDTRYIQCTINATSDLANTGVQQQQNNQNAIGGAAGGATQTASTNVGLAITTSNRGFMVNGNWEAMMRKMSPTRRFIGEGELVFLSPTGADAVAGLAYQGYSGLINAIVQAVSGLGNNFNPAIFTQAQVAINNALSSLPGFLAGAGLDSVQESGDTVKVKVRGTLRYL